MPTQVLDILGRALGLLGHRFLRIDGSTAAETRQPILDRFAAEAVRRMGEEERDAVE
jgi:SNF2 family DNA or RNA helicase